MPWMQLPVGSLPPVHPQTYYLGSLGELFNVWFHGFKQTDYMMVEGGIAEFHKVGAMILVVRNRTDCKIENNLTG